MELSHFQDMFENVIKYSQSMLPNVHGSSVKASLFTLGGHATSYTTTFTRR